MGIRTIQSQDGRSLPVFGLGTAQNVSYNAAGGASTQSVAMGANTNAVLISGVTSSVRVAIGKSPTASASSTLFPAPFMLIFQAGPGDQVAVLGNDATTGSIIVTELAGQPAIA